MKYIKRCIIHVNFGDHCENYIVEFPLSSKQTINTIMESHIGEEYKIVDIKVVKYHHGSKMKN